jgi:predicted HicB family RNase H-like nuclease
MGARKSTKKDAEATEAEKGEVVFALRLPADLHRELKLYSVSAGTSLNKLIVERMVAWWQKNPSREQFAKLAKGKPVP